MSRAALRFFRVALLTPPRTSRVQVYARQKGQLLADHAFLSFLGLAGFWSFLTPSAAMSYGVGALLGGLYIFLLQRQVDGVGASTVEEAAMLATPCYHTSNHPDRTLLTLRPLPASPTRPRCARRRESVLLRSSCPF